MGRWPWWSPISVSPAPFVDSSAGAMIVGTPSYMAPEQASGGVVDHRADVYALCAVAYALLTGAPPFRVERVADLTARPADVGPPPLAKSLGAPATLDGLFTSGLATDPHRRPPSAAILADAFDQLAAEMQGQPPRGDEPPPSRLSRCRRTRLRSNRCQLHRRHRPSPSVPVGPRPSTSP